MLSNSVKTKRIVESLLVWSVSILLFFLVQIIVIFVFLLLLFLVRTRMVFIKDILTFKSYSVFDIR